LPKTLHRERFLIQATESTIKRRAGEARKGP
jgi:hypothetical protein